MAGKHVYENHRNHHKIIQYMNNCGSRGKDGKPKILEEISIDFFSQTDKILIFLTYPKISSKLMQNKQKVKHLKTHQNQSPIYP